MTEHEKSSYEKMKQGQVKFKTFYVTDDKKNKRHNGGNYSAPPMGMSNRLTVVLQQELH